MFHLSRVLLCTFILGLFHHGSGTNTKDKSDGSKKPPPPKCSPPKPKCGPNEKFIPDKVSCPGDSCILNYIAIDCVADQPSSPGCVCIDGYLRSASGDCIPSDQCLRLECVKDPNAVSGCGNRCGKTCKTYKNKPKACSQACVENGCECRKDYIYDENVELCVKPGNCTKQCYGANEEYTSCMYADCLTPRTCNQVGFPSKIPCPKYRRGGCPSGCVCKQGYVRDSCGKCIDIQQCPSCGGDPNAESGCGNYCGKSCTDFYRKDIACPLYCKVNGCDCKKGYVYDANKKKCVKPDKCSDYGCPDNSSYNKCDYKCPTDYCPKDDQPQPVCDPPYSCTNGGCRCNLNYRRNDDDQCIVASECPAINCTRPNEVFDTCPSACLAEHCEDRDNQPSTCNTLVLNCQPMCVCEEGYWRNENGTCVEPEYCPRPCCYDYPCKADCFNHDSTTRPTGRYARTVWFPGECCPKVPPCQAFTCPSPAYHPCTYFTCNRHV